MNQSEVHSSTKLADPIALLESAINLYKQRFTTFFTILLIPLLVSIISWLLPFSIKVSGVVPLLGLISFIVSLLGGLALLYSIKDNTGIEASYRKSWTNIFSYFWVMILSIIIIVGGLFLFAIPGIIFAAWFAFAGYIFVYEETRGMNALLKSKEYVKGRWFSVFSRLAVIFVFYIIIYLSLTLLNRFLGFPQIVITIANYVINAIIGPISPIYMVLLYKNLKAVKNSGSLNAQ